MKKLTVLLVFALALTLLCGCAVSNPGDASEASSKPTEESPVSSAPESSEVSDTSVVAESSVIAESSEESEISEAPKDYSTDEVSGNIRTHSEYHADGSSVVTVYTYDGDVIKTAEEKRYDGETLTGTTSYVYSAEPNEVVSYVKETLSGEEVTERMTMNRAADYTYLKSFVKGSDYVNGSVRDKDGKLVCTTESGLSTSDGETYDYESMAFYSDGKTKDYYLDTYTSDNGLYTVYLFAGSGSEMARAYNDESAPNTQFFILWDMSHGNYYISVEQQSDGSQELYYGILNEDGDSFNYVAGMLIGADGSMLDSKNYDVLSEKDLNDYITECASGMSYFSVTAAYLGDGYDKSFLFD